MFHLSSVVNPHYDPASIHLSNWQVTWCFFLNRACLHLRISRNNHTMTKTSSKRWVKCSECCRLCALWVMSKVAYLWKDSVSYCCDSHSRACLFLIDPIRLPKGTAWKRRLLVGRVVGFSPFTLFLPSGCWEKAGKTHNALYRFNNVPWLVLGVGRRGPKPDSDWLGVNGLNDGGVKFNQSFDLSVTSSHLWKKLGFRHTSWLENGYHLINVHWGLTWHREKPCVLKKQHPWSADVWWTNLN